MKAIPFFDLSQQHKKFRKQFTHAFNGIVDRSEFVLGGEVKKFEESFASFIGSKYAIGVSSGLEALELSLRVLNVGSGDEVIVPANTFIATALAVTAVGATPVFVDCDSQRCLISLDSVKQALTDRTKAIIPVHLYGQPVDMEPLMALAKERHIAIVEDACQAHGAHIDGKYCGNFGQCGCFSFYPSKNLGAMGDGGMITTNSQAYADKLRLLRNYGSVVKYKHEIPGFNNRLDSLQAAMLNIKLPHLKEWNERRVMLAGRYDERLEAIKEIHLLKPRRGFYAVYHLYVIRTDKRQALEAFLHERQIGFGIHYPIPIHQQPAYQGLAKKMTDLSVAEKDAGRLLTLPMFPEMTPKMVGQVCDVIAEFYGQ